MASYVKEGNKVVVVLAPGENENAAQNLIEAIKKAVGNTGETLLVNSSNLQGSEYFLS